MKKFSHTVNWSVLSQEELENNDLMLVKAAQEATAGSWSPYSGFSVGAALLLDDGTVVTGSNQENAAYPSGLCAERTALFAAGHAHPGKAVVALAIAARNKNGFTAQPITPCGACRQVLAETEQRGGKPIRYILYGTQGTMIIEGGTDAILPFCFGADSMK
ncbi:MAG: cytidine deaminase [Bacteroidaceae bacterium]|nr:cytidine deaminase [Bacteroidaceae bacterium]